MAELSPPLLSGEGLRGTHANERQKEEDTESDPSNVEMKKVSRASVLPAPRKAAPDRQARGSERTDSRRGFPCWPSETWLPAIP